MRRVVLLRSVEEWQPLGEITDPRLPVVVDTVKFISLGMFQTSGVGRTRQDVLVFHVKLTPAIKASILEFVGRKWGS